MPAPIDIPAGLGLGPGTRMTLRDIVAQQQSPFTGAAFVYEWETSARWEATIQIVARKGAAAALARAFLAELRGGLQTFRFGDPTATRSGTGQIASTGTTWGFDDDTVFDDGFGWSDGDAALAAGAAAGATSVTIEAVAASQTVLDEGDYLQIGDDLYLVRLGSALVASAGGVGVVSVRPPLRRDYAPGTPVIFEAPRGVFRVVGTATASWEMDVGDIVYFPAFTAVEAL